TTGASADEWVAARPGSEFALALGLAHVIVAESLGPAAAERASVKNALDAWTPDAVAKQTEVPAETVTRLARLFAQRSPGLALAGGISTQGNHGTALVAAVNVLNYVAGNVGRTLQFDRTLTVDGLATFAQLADELKGMADGKVDALVVHGVNPLYATPACAGDGAARAEGSFLGARAGAEDRTSVDLLRETPLSA